MPAVIKFAGTATFHDCVNDVSSIVVGTDVIRLGDLAPGETRQVVAPVPDGLPMPVYAIGGLTRADLPEARRHRAHGVALMGAAFS